MSKEQRIERIAYFFHASPENTLAYHRVIGPLKYLGIDVIHAFDEGKVNVERIADGDIVVVQRDFPRYFEEYRRIINLAREENKPVVYDLDDLLFELPEDHPDRIRNVFSNALLPALQALMEADLVTVATSPLKDYFQDFNANIRVLPNFLNDALWKLKDPSIDRDEDGRVTIGYMGGESHAPDLRMLVPIFLELLKRYPSRLKFTFWGIGPPSELSESKSVHHVPLRSYEYPKFVDEFQNETADIFIAPLVDNLFNSCKSAIKFLEYTALGVPGVYSSVEPYSTVIKNGHDGFLASTPDDWLEHLCKLIENPDTRLELASNAQETVRAKWLLSKNATLWLNAYQEALERESAKGEDRPIFTLLRSIAAQESKRNTEQEERLDALTENIVKSKADVQELTAQLAKADAELQTLNAQLAEREKKMTALRTQLRARELATKKLNTKLSEQTEQIEGLFRQIDEYERKIQTLRERVDIRTQKEQILEMKTADQERYIKALTEQLQNLRTSRAWRTSTLLRGVWSIFFPPSSVRSKIVDKILSIFLVPLSILDEFRKRRDLNLIRESGFFDGQWYRGHNPDVAISGIDPARHFLLYGGVEGRDPGPSFSSGWYLDTYADVKAEGINPLIHYIKFGRAEGRSTKPDSTSIRSGLGGFGATLPELEQDRYVQAYLNSLKVARSQQENEYEPLKSEAISIEEPPARLIAFYLPQFHPIPENDQWWGKGFTEWTNVSKSVPQFTGHYQPHLPGELGYYDLRVPEVQRRQAELAKFYGIYGFCFYYYWFDGRRLLERPIEQFISDPEIDMPFCLCWANENWTRRWDGLDDEILIAQSHTKESDFEFIRDITPYLKSNRYIHIDGRPLVLVYRANLLSDPLETATLWREYAIAEGLGNPFLVATQVFGYLDNPEEIGFDAAIEFPPNTLPVKDISNQYTPLNPSFNGYIYDYRELVEKMIQNRATDFRLLKTVMPSWDNTARYPSKPSVFMNATPSSYEEWLANAIGYTQENFPRAERFVFINAWNEWAEGNHLEPDRKYGYAFLQATANALKRIAARRDSWKILFISHDANLGGAQLCLLSIIGWFLDRTDIDVKVLCLEDGELLPEFLRLSETLLYSDISHLSSDDRIETLLEFCEGSPDLIYANTVVSGKIYPWLQKLDIPILSHVHELNASIERYAGDFFDEVLKHTDAFIACSGAVRRNLIEQYHVSEETSVTAYSYVHSSDIDPYQDEEKVEARHELGLETDKNLIVGCGIGMPFRKGADLYIETAKKLLELGEKDFHFYWIGDFRHEEEDAQYGKWAHYLDNLQDEDIREHVTFLGKKDDPRKYMRAGDIFLLPSREDPFARVVLEAADSGLPIICFEGAGGSPEFVRDDAGFVVPIEDTNEMAAKVSFLMGNKTAREEMGRKARERFLKEFSMDKIMPGVLSTSRRVAGKNPRVSVIVPNYNHAKYLPRRLESILSQTFQDFEVFLMDDASTDDSVSILRKYTDWPDVHLRINQVNSGSPFLQWLTAFSQAQGDYVWIAESDDLCEPDFLEQLLPAFNDPQVQIAYCASKVIDADGEVQGNYTEMEYLKSISKTRWKKSYCIPADQEINEAFGIKNTILNISAVLFRRTEFDDKFRNTISKMHIGGDTFLLLNLMKGGKVYYDPSFLNYHRRHGSSIVGQVLSERGDEHLRKFFQDFYINKRFIAKNFRLSSRFEERFEHYVKDLWGTLAPDKPYQELKLYFPIDEIRELIRREKQYLGDYKPSGQLENPTEMTANYRSPDQHRTRVNRKSIVFPLDDAKLAKYESTLRQIDRIIENVPPKEIPGLFRDIPLEVFGWLTLQDQNEFPNIRDFLPSMPPDEIQMSWTGATGEILLERSVAFIDSVVRLARTELNLEDLSELKLLDFGCGWGRLLRLFYKYIPTDNLYAVDAWETSIRYLIDTGIRAHVARIDEICKRIPFNVNFNLVISFSVFTHLSEKTANAALHALRESIDENGLMIITIRPFDYIRYYVNQHDIAATAEELETSYRRDGFVFIPHNREPINGEITFGDTFISIEFIERNWKEWRLVGSHINTNDPFQELVILKPR